MRKVATTNAWRGHERFWGLVSAYAEKKFGFAVVYTTTPGLICVESDPFEEPLLVQLDPSEVYGLMAIPDHDHAVLAAAVRIAALVERMASWAPEKGVR